MPSRPLCVPARRFRPGLAIVLACGAVLLGACAGKDALKQSSELRAEGRTAESLDVLEAALKNDPEDPRLRAAYTRARGDALVAALDEAEVGRAAGNATRATRAYRLALRIDPGNARASAGLEQLERDAKVSSLLESANAALQASDLVQAEQHASAASSVDPVSRAARAVKQRVDAAIATAQASQPRLKTSLERPITLEINDQPIRKAFELIAKNAGINFIFDKDVRTDTKINVMVRNAMIDDVIKLVLLTHQLDHKVINDNSILIYPNNANKQKDYQEQVVKRFYLANSDPKQVLNLVRTLVKTKDLYIDEKLNLLVMKDTVDAVRLAERLIAAQDLAEPEVMLDVEVLEVARGRLRDLGLRFPERVNFGPIGAGTAAAPSTVELKERNFETASIANPALVLNLRQQDTDTSLLANPRIRVKNRDKAKIHIGDRVPVITTTTTPNVGVSSSVSYLDVGLKLDVEPNVYLEDEVQIKVQLEVSNIVREVQVQGTLAFQVGTRSAATTLRLKDGETEVLAGLISNEDRLTANSLPGLGDLPLLGRLFGSNNRNKNRTEIVLLITPRILRNINITSASPIAYGTDAAIGSAPLTIRQTAPKSLAIATPQSAAGKAPSAAPPPEPEGVPQIEPAVVTIGAPQQVSIGGEFGVNIAFTNVDSGRAVLGLVYDPSFIRQIGGDAGRQDIELEAGQNRELRFQVVATQPGESMFAVDVVSAQRNDGALNVLPPAPVTIRVVKPE
jgi:general secretion pathway protein D